MLVGVLAKETAVRRRMDELVEAIICSSAWGIAA